MAQEPTRTQDVSSELRKPDPEPGEVLEAVNQAIAAGNFEEFDAAAINDFEEQKEVAEQKLETYLHNIADSPGARKVVEKFYEDEHDEDIDASSPEELAEYIGSVDDIITGWLSLSWPLVFYYASLHPLFTTYCVVLPRIFGFEPPDQ